MPDSHFFSLNILWMFGEWGFRGLGFVFRAKDVSLWGLGPVVRGLLVFWVGALYINIKE